MPSVYKSFTSLIKFISKYFGFFLDAIVNASESLLLMYRNATDSPILMVG